MRFESKSLPTLILVLSVALTISTGADTSGNRLDLRDSSSTLRFTLPSSGNFVSLFYSSDIDRPFPEWELLTLLQAPASRSGQIDVSAYTSDAQGFFRLQPLSLEAPSNYVWVQPGEFLMGSPDTEPNRFNDEGPQHSVTIENGFWLSAYEVTQRDYGNVMKNNPSRANGNPEFPVENVSWFEAVLYCQRLTEQAEANGTLPPGFEYRLPTEAEWEYACRAGTTTAFSFGETSSLLGNFGWWADNSGAHPMNVGQLSANDWGLYDMHGNVFEWTLSPYAAYPGGQVRDRKVDYRAIRGGAFICPDYICRAATRLESAPSISRSWLTGFRVALAKRIPMDLEAIRSTFD